MVKKTTGVTKWLTYLTALSALPATRSGTVAIRNKNNGELVIPIKIGENALYRAVSNRINKSMTPDQALTLYKLINAKNSVVANNLTNEQADKILNKLKNNFPTMHNKKVRLLAAQRRREHRAKILSMGAKNLNLKIQQAQPPASRLNGNAMMNSLEEHNLPRISNFIKNTTSIHSNVWELLEMNLENQPNLLPSKANTTLAIITPGDKKSFREIQQITKDNQNIHLFIDDLKTSLKPVDNKKLLKRIEKYGNMLKKISKKNQNYVKSKTNGVVDRFLASKVIESLYISKTDKQILKTINDFENTPEGKKDIEKVVIYFEELTRYASKGIFSKDAYGQMAAASVAWACLGKAFLMVKSQKFKEIAVICFQKSCMLFTKVFLPFNIINAALLFIGVFPIPYLALKSPKILASAGGLLSVALMSLIVYMSGYPELLAQFIRLFNSLFPKF